METEVRLFMTIPTAGTRAELLNALIDQSGLPREQIVLVATRPNLKFPEGCIVIEDLGSPNIQRWWRRGIEEAKSRGASAVAVLNDDIRVTPETLPSLHRALVGSGATVASPSRPFVKTKVHKGRLVPYEPRIWGCLWVLDLASDLRPDERFVWWYGDCDLDIRARRDYNGIVTLDVEYEHMFPGEGTFKSPSLVEQTDLDAIVFEKEYAKMLRKSRRLVRVLKPIQKVKTTFGLTRPVQ